MRECDARASPVEAKFEALEATKGFSDLLLSLQQRRREKLFTARDEAPPLSAADSKGSESAAPIITPHPKRVRSSAHARDVQLAGRLWTRATELTGVSSG